MSEEPTTFQVSVNGGPTQDLTVKTSLYISAAAAVPAVLGYDDFPLTVTIWVDHLQPDYPPLNFMIEEAGAPLLIRSNKLIKAGI